MTYPKTDSAAKNPKNYEGMREARWIQAITEVDSERFAETSMEQKAQATDKELTPQVKNRNWFYSLLPISIATGPVSTLVQLQILELNGTTIDIGLATTLFNAISIPSAIIWGLVTDRLHVRKLIIVLSSLAVAANIFLFAFARTVSSVALLYGLFSLVSAASATPLNLLVMETQPKSRWPTAFARFSMVSSVGITVSLFVGAIWVGFLPLEYFVIPLSLLAAATGFLSFAWINEPTFAFEQENIPLQRKSFYHRLLALPLVFLRIPRLGDFKSVFKGLRFGLTRQLPLLYLSIFIFYVASGIFNTSLVPSLIRASLTKSDVFFVSLAGITVQVAAFYFAGPYIERRSLKATAITGLTLRSSCYALIGIAAATVTGLSYYGTTLVLYPLASGIGFAAYYTASNTMVFNSLGLKGQGSRLGVYSALVGVGATIGSLISGFASYFFGFTSTFILAALVLALSAGLTSFLNSEIG